MDVPSWHPANQDADTRRLAMAATATIPRTEFKVMAGSSADTSTDAGQQFMDELRTGGNGPAAAVEGRGLGASDRLYLMEQQKIADALKNKRKAEDDAQLQSFRSTAMKLQAAQKAALLAPDVVAAIKTAPSATATAKKPAAAATKAPLASPIVTIKPKKRRTDAADARSSTTKRKKQQQAQATPAATRANSAPKASTTPSKPSPAVPDAVTAKAPSALLLQGYSSSSDDEDSATPSA